MLPGWSGDKKTPGCSFNIRNKSYRLCSYAPLPECYSYDHWITLLSLDHLSLLSAPLFVHNRWADSAFGTAGATHGILVISRNPSCDFKLGLVYLC